MRVNYQIVYWRDIPAQVKVRSGRERVARQLSARFQEAIDEAAMLARATSSDDYLDDWRASEWQPGEGALEILAETLVAEIEAAYTPKRLEALKSNRGYE